MKYSNESIKLHQFYFHMIYLHVSTCTFSVCNYFGHLISPPHVCHHAPPYCSSLQPSRSELDETLKRLQQHKGVTGVIVVNGEEGEGGGGTDD